MYNFEADIKFPETVNDGCCDLLCYNFLLHNYTKPIGLASVFRCYLIGNDYHFSLKIAQLFPLKRGCSAPSVVYVIQTLYPCLNNSIERY